MILETARLALRRLEFEDAAFIVDLLNKPSFVQHIGDKGVRTLDDARRYLQDGPIQSYEQHGFGLYGVASKETGVLMGTCGLLKRDALEDVDLGYAFLPAYWSKGYALEAAQAVLYYSEDVLGLRRVVAIVSEENIASIRLLEKLGFAFERRVQMPGEKDEVRLFGRDF